MWLPPHKRLTHAIIVRTGADPFHYIWADRVTRRTRIGGSGALLGVEALIESQTQIAGSVVRLVGRG
jgi:hypothetical protein